MTEREWSEEPFTVRDSEQAYDFDAIIAARLENHSYLLESIHGAVTFDEQKDPPPKEGDTEMADESRYVTHPEIDAKIEAMRQEMERHSQRVEHSVDRVEHSMEHHSTRVETAVNNVSGIADSIKSDNRNTRNMVLGAVTLAVILFALFINSERSWIQRSIDSVKTEIQNLKTDRESASSSAKEKGGA